MRFHCFLYFTKSSKKQQKAAKSSWGRRKDLIWFVRVCCLCALIRGLQNLGAHLKGFNCCGAKMSLRWAALRFAKPRNFLRRRTSCHFLRCAKSNQKAHGAKPCDPRFKALPEVSLQKLPAARVETGFACKTAVKRLWIGAKGLP